MSVLCMQITLYWGINMQSRQMHLGLQSRQMHLGLQSRQIIIKPLKQQQDNNQVTMTSIPRLMTDKVLESPHDLEAPMSPRNMISSLFSKQFMGNVKNELSIKSQSSRRVENLDATKSGEVSKLKAEVELISNKLREVRASNKELKRIVKQLERVDLPKSRDLQQDGKNGHILSRESRLTLNSSEIQITVRGTLSVQEERNLLLKRIEQLQLYRSIKDGRLKQLLAKQAWSDSQIRLLQSKEENLQSEVYSLRETMKIQLIECSKPIRNTNNSDVVDIRSNNQQGLLELPFDRVVENQTSNALSASNNQDFLLNSQCIDLAIPQNQLLSKLQKKEVEVKEEEIDGLIELELPFIDSNGFKAKDDEQVNLQTSQTYMHSDAPGSSDFQQSRVNIATTRAVSTRPMNQSIIAINL